MKKNMLLALLAIVLMPATFEVAAAESSCTTGCRKPVKKACPVACPKKVKTCPAKKVCKRVSKCLTCEEKAAQKANEANIDSNDLTLDDMGDDIAADDFDFDGERPLMNRQRAGMQNRGNVAPPSTTAKPVVSSSKAPPSTTAKPAAQTAAQKRAQAAREAAAQRASDRKAREFGARMYENY